MTKLDVREIRKSFGGVEVLRGVSLAVEPGSVTALIGPNGAGKSTLANIVSGFVSADAGSVTFDGHDVTHLAPHQRAAAGIGRSFQNLELFSDLSVRENVLLGLSGRRSGFRRWFLSPGLDDWKQVDDQVADVGLRDVAERRVEALAFGQAKLVEPARVASMKPTVLVLDEPAAGLTARRSESLGTWIREVASGGAGVLLIEHNMTLVMDVADYIYVLDHGERIASGTPSGISRHPAVIDAYLGDGFHA